MRRGGGGGGVTGPTSRMGGMEWGKWREMTSHEFDLFLSPVTPLPEVPGIRMTHKRH